ncbi:MAG TPA: hypothetical protein VN541_11070 [Tepidisphaeraceae bacterium]|nr:hypothetical protein [Tepidisphaeraceae bacterium]
MVAVTATFAVLLRRSDGEQQIITLLTDLSDIRPYDAEAPELPTYSEAVRIATERGLSRQPRIGFLKRYGVQEFVPVCERVVLPSADEVDHLAASITC